MSIEQPVMRAVDLTVAYGRHAPVVEGVSLQVGPGETVGLVGESGSGKTTVGLAALGLIPIAGGDVAISGRSIVGLRAKALRAVQSDVSMVFQSSTTSLDPRRTVAWSIAEPLLARGVPRAQRHARVDELLHDVNLPRDCGGRYPHELSGGQKQRVGIARALAADPVLLVCDEPTSALDVSVQAQIVNLLIRLQDERQLAMLFISHDLAIVEAVSHRIAVLRRGRIVEEGEAAAVLRAPAHEYTQALVAAVPTLTDGKDTM